MLFHDRAQEAELDTSCLKVKVLKLGGNPEVQTCPSACPSRRKLTHGIDPVQLRRKCNKLLTTPVPNPKISAPTGMLEPFLCISLYPLVGSIAWFVGILDIFAAF